MSQQQGDVAKGCTSAGNAEVDWLHQQREEEKDVAVTKMVD